MKRGYIIRIADVFLGAAMAISVLGASLACRADSAGLPRKLELAFSSGAGGWGTEIVVRKDGSFKGSYHDSDLGDTGKGYRGGTVRYCNFSGRFGKIEKLGKKKYSMSLVTLEPEGDIGDTAVRNRVRYVRQEPYGMEKGKEFILYCPGYAVGRLPGQAREWLCMAAWISAGEEKLDGYVLYNKMMGYAFYGGLD